MPLINNNDPIDDIGLLNAMATVLLPGTQLQASNGQVYVNSWDAIETGQATFPCCVLEAGQQSTRHVTFSTWQDVIIVRLVLMDRWDQQTATMSQIRATLKADIGRIKSNLENNANLYLNGTANNLNIRSFLVAGYGTKEEKNSAFKTVSCHCQIECHGWPYTSTR